jgi:hypothetical protein
MERVTGKPVHPWLRRGLFFSHRYPAPLPLAQCIRNLNHFRF